MWRILLRTEVDDERRRTVDDMEDRGRHLLPHMIPFTVPDTASLVQDPKQCGDVDEIKIVGEINQPRLRAWLVRVTALDRECTMHGPSSVSV